MKVIYRRTKTGSYEKGVYLNFHNIYGLSIFLFGIITYTIINSNYSLWAIIPFGIITFGITLNLYSEFIKKDINLRDSTFYREYLNSFMKKDKWYTRNKEIDEFFGINSIDLVFEDRMALIKFYDFCIKEIKETDFYNPKHFNTDRIYRLDNLLRIHNEMLKKKST
tara:strand:- start:3537 stop:4034 length:498 start_codon:yes stop_codon:yes gene_type:complete